VFERFTDRGRRVLVLAQEEARLLNHSYIGTEHLLLGLLHEQEGLAARALGRFDITLDAVRSAVEETVGIAAHSPSSSPPFTPRTKKVLELAVREAMQLGHTYIGTEHLLLGLIREGEGVAAHTITDLGVGLGPLRNELIRLMTGERESAESVRTDTTTTPQCARCGANLLEEARYRMIAVPSGEDPQPDDILNVPVVYCNRCGTALGNLDLPREPNPSRITDALPVRPRGEVRLIQSGSGRVVPDLDQLAAHHIPNGPPPDDQEAALVNVERVFEKMGERSPDGAALVNVERGENLGPCEEELQRRFPQYIYEGAGKPPEKIKFLNASEAVVWMSTAVGIHEGRAVLVDGQWKVSRATFCGLAAGGGVTCPPPL
jgi:Clp amino terminal domain, pathogenicity island component